MVDRNQSVKIKKEWLKNSELRVLDDGQVSWGRFTPPDLSPRAGDLRYTIRRFERPEQISYEFYGIYELWWVIAVANGIRFPIVEFKQGMTLRIPDPNYILDRFTKPGVSR